MGFFNVRCSSIVNKLYIFLFLQGYEHPSEDDHYSESNLYDEIFNSEAFINFKPNLNNVDSTTEVSSTFLPAECQACPSY